MTKKILITGAGGFIGSHLVERCVELGFNIRAFVHYNSKNNWGWLEESAIKNDIEIISGDIRDFDSVNKAMKGCSEVFHLAALVGIPYSYASPLAYIKTNVEGTYNVLESAKEHQLTNIIITSSSEAYGTAQYVPIDEKHPIAGQSPYSASKIAGEQIALSYQYSFDMPIKIIRPFNTFGPRQSARAVIPTIATQILTGKKKLKLGNINATRDLIFVKDTAEGFIEIAKSKKLIGEITNIGAKEEISVANLVKLVSKILKTEIKIESDDTRLRPGKSEVTRLLCENKKIIANTNWKPKYSLEQGLVETIEWLKQNLNLYKADIYNV